MREYILEASPGICAARLVGPWILTPPTVTISSGFDGATLPPVAAAMSTMTAPGRMLATISSVISRGAGRPGIWAVVTMMSASATKGASASCCRAWVSASTSTA